MFMRKISTTAGNIVSSIKCYACSSLWRIWFLWHGENKWKWQNLIRKTKKEKKGGGRLGGFRCLLQGKLMQDEGNANISYTFMSHRSFECHAQ